MLEIGLGQEIGFIEQGAGHGGDLAMDQVLYAETGIDPLHLFVQAGLLEQRLERMVVAVKHHRLAAQGFQILRIGRQKQHLGGVLKDARQRHQGFAIGTRQQQLAVGHAKLGLSGTDVGQRIAAGSGLLDADFQPRLTVIALRLGGVIAGKLVLMKAGQLQDDPFQGSSRQAQAQQPGAQSQDMQQAGMEFVHRLCLAMKTRRSNKWTSCSFFKRAPCSGGTVTL